MNENVKLKEDTLINVKDSSKRTLTCLICKKSDLLKPKKKEFDLTKKTLKWKVNLIKWALSLLKWETRLKCSLIIISEMKIWSKQKLVKRKFWVKSREYLSSCMKKHETSL